MNNMTPFDYFMILVLSTIVFTGGGVIGAGLSKDGYVLEGRNQAVILCTENPKDCKIEYDYLKLKENVK